MSDKEKDTQSNKNEELSFEEEGSEHGQIQRLRKKLKKCNEERKEYLDGWQRAKADLINVKKKSEQSKTQSRLLAREQIIEDILPVLDSFQMAFSNTQAWKSVNKEWRIGVENIHTQLLTALKENGITVIEPEVGDDFDPQFHEAQVMTDTDKKNKDDTIRAVQKKGYAVGEKVIRPALVEVAKYTENKG